jgi:hypothetical protein
MQAKRKGKAACAVHPCHQRLVPATMASPKHSGLEALPVDALVSWPSVLHVAFWATAGSCHLQPAPYYCQLLIRRKSKEAEHNAGTNATYCTAYPNGHDWAGYDAFSQDCCSLYCSMFHGAVMSCNVNNNCFL